MSHPDESPLKLLEDAFKSSSKTPPPFFYSGVWVWIDAQRRHHTATTFDEALKGWLTQG